MVVWRVGYRMHDVASRYARAAASHWLVREIMYCTETCVRARCGVHRRAQRVVIPCGHVSYVSPTDYSDVWFGARRCMRVSAHAACLLGAGAPCLCGAWREV